MSVPQRSSAAGGLTPPNVPSGQSPGLVQRARPYLWVPSLYLAMGIPFNVVMGTALRMYKSLDFVNGDITVALGSVGLAWSLKPLWAAFLDMYRTKKFFVLMTEVVFGALMFGVAISLPASHFFQISIAIFWIAAFVSSTQDICGDGIYLTALDKAAQARWTGVQSAFWNLGRILATGALVWSVDKVRIAYNWTPVHMWACIFAVCGTAMVLFAVYHYFYLPVGSVVEKPESAKAVMRDFLATAETFFHKRAFWGMIAFVFLYRLGEGLLLLETQLFLQSSTADGGLGLTAGQVSAIDAIWGTGAMLVGGLIGGWFVSRRGLRATLPILGLCLNIPHLTYVVLSQVGAAGHSASYSLIVSMVVIEKLGYGFGFVGNMIYMMQQIAPGRATMTHYAFATALMNLTLVPTNMISGPLADWLGFSTYFLVVMFASVPSAWAAFKAPFPRNDDPEHPPTADVTITADDPTQLTPVQRRVQTIAGQASMYAMLNLLTLLIADAKVLGTLQGKAAGTGQVQFFVLVGIAVVKGFFSLMTLRLAARATAEARQNGETHYVLNARGARITTYVCAVLTLAILVFGARMAF